MRNLLLALTAAIVTSPATVHALPIVGDILLYGDFRAVNSTWSSVGLDKATGVDFIGNDFAVDSVNGDFAASGIKKAATGTIQDFQFSPVLSPYPVNPLWSIGGFNFILDSVTVVFQSKTLLLLSGTGTVTGVGFDDTRGVWDFRATPGVGRFGFGAMTHTVPEPGALLLFGAGLLGIAFSRQKFSKHP